MIDPYQSGFAHGKNGSLAPCPFPAGTKERALWMDGYYEGTKHRRYGR